MSSAMSSFSGGVQGYAEGILSGRLYERQAEGALREGTYAEEMSRKKTKALLGRQRTLYTKAGVSISGDSPLEVMADTALKGEREALEIRRKTWDQYNMLRFYAKVARRAGRQALSAGRLGGALSIGQTAVSSMASYGVFSGGGGGSGPTASEYGRYQPNYNYGYGAGYGRYGGRWGY